MGEALKLVEETLVEETLNEASEIDKSKVKIPKNLEKVIKSLNGKLQSVWDGIHGIVLKYDAGQFGAPPRLDKKELKALSSVKELRWIECRDSLISFGMTRDIVIK